jgi:hypothetical protein
MKGIANSLGDSSLCCAPFRMTNLYLLDISLLFELIQPLLLNNLFSPCSLFLFFFLNFSSCPVARFGWRWSILQSSIPAIEAFS